MDKRYDMFCATDPMFFDSLSGSDGSEKEFAASVRPIPQGWTRHVNDDWVVFGPQHPELPDQGWKIHISGCMDNAEKIIDTTWEYCVDGNVSFKFLRGPRIVLMRNSKYARRAMSGKLVTIYPRDEAQCARILRELDTVLAGEPGPYILSDLRWADGPLYVRYGGFVPRHCVSETGELVPAIVDTEGRAVPDTREPVFTVPSWVSLPDFLQPHLAARDALAVGTMPYRIDSVRHFSNGGGLYVGRDSDDRPVVLKEARPHAGLDATGDDAVTRLRRERDALTTLSGLDGVPVLRDYVVLGDHEFLVMDFIDAVPLNKLMVQRYPLTDHRADDEARAEYRSWVLDIHAQVQRIVENIHARGLVYGDLHLFNVLVRPDGSVALVDFEVAAPVAANLPPALRNQGFAAPRDRTGFDVDRYALACLRLALFLPLTSLIRFAPGKAAQLAEVVADRFPVPQQLLADDVATITGPSARDAAVGTDLAEFSADPDQWHNLRTALAAAIVASATPDRDDRLFPGDIEQFESGGLGLAYGAAGVLYALSASGAGRFPDYEAWLRRRALDPAPGTRSGLYDGLHGVAFLFEEFGCRQDSLDIVDICLREHWEGLGTGLHSGLAGAGLNLLHLYARTGERTLHDTALRIGELVADRLGEADSVDAVSGGRRPTAGLLHGSSGPALLFLRLYAETGDRDLLDHAAVALRQDLRRCTIREDGAMEVDEGWRTMPYLATGSTGIGVVLEQYLGVRPDEQFAEAATAIRAAASSPLYVQSGLFAGRAGILYYLTQRPGAGRRADPDIAAHVRRMAWHALPYGGGIAFPGEQLLRLSMDLATGTAGVLFALASALAEDEVRLPLLAAHTPDRSIPTISGRR